jgi:peptidyl-prolyl cis-trans isomerase A (cyclophilin A)
MRKLLVAIIAVSFAGSGAAQTQPATSTSTTAKTKAKAGTTPKSKSAATPAAKPAEQSPPATEPAKPGEPPSVIFDTSMGQIACVLFPDKAPKTVANFISLAMGTKSWTNPMTGQVNKGKSLYEGTIFHRVMPNFMIQGGDPIGNGTGGPGYRFEDEFSPDLRFDRPGRLAMANSGPDTNGSQFFITEVPTPHLDDRHTIFGQCDDPSVNVVKTIARVATDPRNNKPNQDVVIKKITILGVPQPPVKATPKRPVRKKVTPTTTK